MEKNVLSVRIRNETELQLEELMQDEIEKAKSFNIRSKSKAEIVEEAIEFYFLQKKDGKFGFPYFNYFASQTEEIFKEYWEKMALIWKDVYYQNIKNSELISALHKAVKEDYDEERFKEVVYGRSLVEDEIDKKMIAIMKDRGGR